MVLEFIRQWGMVVGPALDLVGAVLVFQGVRIGLNHAIEIETVAIPRLFDDLGSEENLRQNEQLSAARAAERVRASRWALAGLLFFILGFSVQLTAGWPAN